MLPIFFLPAVLPRLLASRSHSLFRAQSRRKGFAAKKARRSVLLKMAETTRRNVFVKVDTTCHIALRLAGLIWCCQL